MTSAIFLSIDKIIYTIKDTLIESNEMRMMKSFLILKIKPIKICEKKITRCRFI